MKHQSEPMEENSWYGYTGLFMTDFWETIS